MNKFDIVKNAKRNLLFGIINKAILMLCPFVERTVIQYILGAQYLGLNSLFSSILSVLNLAELGFSTAVVYHMYKPIAEGDTESVNQLLNLYKKVYRVIGSVVLVIGLCLLPFLKYLINGDCPSNLNIHLLYFIYLVNVSLSYFLFAYMSSLVTAYQRNDLISICTSATKIGLTVAQIVALVTTKNYYIFLLLMPAFTIANNLFTYFVARKNFPEYHCCGTVPKEKQKEIKKLVTGTFIQKACATTRNSLDSICISAFLGLSLTAIYNNYYYIFSAITTCLYMISASLTGGIGNHVVTKTKEENFKELQNMDFLYLILSGECAICLMCLTQPFMQLWMGKDMMLSTGAVVLFTIYFYVMKFGDMRSMYMIACGTWWEQKYASILETIINIVLNIVLGKFFGIYGIITATIVSILICNAWMSTSILFKVYFGKEKLISHYLAQMKVSVVNVLLCTLTYLLCHYFINFDKAIITLLIRGIVCVVLPITIYFLLYRNRPEIKYAKSRLLKRT